LLTLDSIDFTSENVFYKGKSNQTEICEDITVHTTKALFNTSVQMCLARAEHNFRYLQEHTIIKKNCYMLTG